MNSCGQSWHGMSLSIGKAHTAERWGLTCDPTLPPRARVVLLAVCPASAPIPDYRNCPMALLRRRSPQPDTTLCRSRPSWFPLPFFGEPVFEPRSEKGPTSSEEPTLARTSITSLTRSCSSKNRKTGFLQKVTEATKNDGISDLCCLCYLLLNVRHSFWACRIRSWRTGRWLRSSGQSYKTLCPSSPLWFLSLFSESRF
jgi:hypothetical protein